ncbi:OsmC family protein [Kutzneria sp. CA-103260]|uniref:OsmC family protein n=1 Tax=Kutzneria sp. CA-103260 TaxID=2802641 RepID=UPI001BA56F55|nr:OsmC family protein [Kutzneria sp. CA-103260]QUQ68508.1 OsmC-like protein [Kutzneria sp. CA-103260]
MSVTVQRIGEGRFVATTADGATVEIGGDGFSAVQLLEAALAACAAMTAEQLITRRGGDSFTVTASGEQAAHELRSVDIAFDLPADEPLATIVPRAVARECKVSRTVEHGAPVTVRLNG